MHSNMILKYMKYHIPLQNEKKTIFITGTIKFNSKKLNDSRFQTHVLGPNRRHYSRYKIVYYCLVLAFVSLDI